MDLLDRLLGHDAWTTKQLLLVSQGLTDEQLDREFDIGYRTVRATLNHIINNVEAWSQTMLGEVRHTAEKAEAPDLTIPSMIARLDRAAANLARVSKAVSQQAAWDEKFLDTFATPPCWKTYGAGIAHVITHSMHHRAQVLYMLRRLDVDEVPEGDVFSWEDQVRRHSPERA
jgi:uncharacterized damage-inducible protein DinB